MAGFDRIIALRLDKVQPILPTEDASRLADWVSSSVPELTERIEEAIRLALGREPNVPPLGEGNIVDLTPADRRALLAVLEHCSDLSRELKVVRDRLLSARAGDERAKLP